MGLRDALRKAAELVVELPNEGGAGAVASPRGEGERAFNEPGQMARKSKEPAALVDDVPKRTRTVGEIVRESDGPDLDQIKVTSPTKLPGLTPDGHTDFTGVYKQANIPVVQFTCEQVLKMLEGLPQDLSIETRRQMVRVSLEAMGKALGATPETIVADASRKLAALAAFVDQLSKQTGQFVTNTEMEIATLHAQIGEKAKAIDSTKQELAQVCTRCDAEADRLDDVLEFFSLDVPPSKYAPAGAQGGNK